MDASPAQTAPDQTAPDQTAPDQTAPDLTDPAGGICARDVTVTYRNGLTALHHASFEIPRGTVTALVGVNGAGKSTLFKAIMGFVPVAAGSITLLGMTVREALRRNLVAYVPQAEEVDWSFPVLVEDVVMMGRFGHMGFLRRPKPVDHAVVEQALRRVNMTDYRKRQIGELSGGQKKRVFLARALAQEGQVILLDEPFTGVDVKTEAQIIALLRDLRDEGRVMLVSTHNLGTVPEFCDRTVLVKGTVLAYGPTETAFTHENLAEAFGGVLRHFTLGGADLHDDEDGRHVTILTDDERPFVQYGEATMAAQPETRAGTMPDASGDDGATLPEAPKVAAVPGTGGRETPPGTQTAEGPNAPGTQTAEGPNAPETQTAEGTPAPEQSAEGAPAPGTRATGDGDVPAGTGAPETRDKPDRDAASGTRRS